VEAGIGSSPPSHCRRLPVRVPTPAGSGWPDAARRGPDEHSGARGIWPTAMAGVDPARRGRQPAYLRLRRPDPRIPQLDLRSGGGSQRRASMVVLASSGAAQRRLAAAAAGRRPSVGGFHGRH